MLKIIIVLIFSFYSCRAISFNDQQLSNLAEICLKNGLQTITIMGDLSFKSTKLLMKQGLKISTKFDNVSTVQLLIKDRLDTVEIDDWVEILKVHTLKKALLILSDDRIVTINEVKNKFKRLTEQALFDIIQFGSNDEVIVKTVMKLREDTIVVNNGKIENGLIIESEMDFQGANLVSISLPWFPQMDMSDCDEKGEHCICTGILPVIMNIMSDSMNFTWDCNLEMEGDWGLFPHIEVKGVLGHLVHKKSDIGLSIWLNELERSNVCISGIL